MGNDWRCTMYTNGFSKIPWELRYQWARSWLRALSKSSPTLGSCRSLGRPTFGPEQSVGSPTFDPVRSVGQPTFSPELSGKRPTFGRGWSLGQPTFGPEQSLLGTNIVVASIPEGPTGVREAGLTGMALAWAGGMGMGPWEASTVDEGMDSTKEIRFRRGEGTESPVKITSELWVLIRAPGKRRGSDDEGPN